VNAVVDEGLVGRVPLTESEAWRWLPVVGPDGEIVTLDLDAGRHELALSTETGGISIDRVCLTTTPQALPEGPGGYDHTAPDTPAGVSARTQGRYAVNLIWEPVAARDLSHYNVYCGAEADFETGRERLIGSPTVAEFLDWGLQSGTQYHYRVTAVDRRGNESEPSGPVAAATEALADRLFAEIEQTWNMQQADELTLPFTAPADGEVVVWGRLRSLDGERRVGVALLLDGEKVDGLRLDLDYICKGHGGPMLETTLWDCLRPQQSSPDARMAYPVTAGEHELTIRHASGGAVEFDRFVITNDLGYEPEGRTSFLIKDSML
jgi:hypothetical protein